MNPIILAVIIVAGIGLLCALILSLASIFFAVPVDEKAEQIRACLPGANCGACGFSGCDGYAAALSKGETTNTALCVPGGNEASAEIAKITGGEAGSVRPMSAVVLCQGNFHNVEQKLEYDGVETCKMAAQLFGGPKSCTYGCIGFGDCVKVCPYNAIFICDGVARINPDRCKACKTCVGVCPRGLITMIPRDDIKTAVLCQNKDKGAQTRKQCKAGCIGCMKCVKACEEGAVKVENNKASVDYEKCTGCGKCHETCPVKCIDLIRL